MSVAVKTFVFVALVVGVALLLAGRQSVSPVIRRKELYVAPASAYADDDSDLVTQFNSISTYREPFETEAELRRQDPDLWAAEHSSALQVIQQQQEGTVAKGLGTMF